METPQKCQSGRPQGSGGYVTLRGGTYYFDDNIPKAARYIIAQPKKGDYFLDIRQPETPDLKIGHEASKIFRRLTKNLGINRFSHELHHTRKRNARWVEDVQQVDIDRIWVRLWASAAIQPPALQCREIADIFPLVSVAVEAEPEKETACPVPARSHSGSSSGSGRG